MIVELLTTGFFSCSVYLFVVGLANAFAVYDLKHDRMNPVSRVHTTPSSRANYCIGGGGRGAKQFLAE